MSHQIDVVGAQMVLAHRRMAAFCLRVYGPRVGPAMYFVTDLTERG